MSAAGAARRPALWTGQSLAGLGVAAIIPTTLALVAAGTRTAREDVCGLTSWSVALVIGAIYGPGISGLVAAHRLGTDLDSGWRWVFLIGVVARLEAVENGMSAYGCRWRRASRRHRHAGGMGQDPPGLLAVQAVLHD